jgi:hypothetical protein
LKASDPAALWFRHRDAKIAMYLFLSMPPLDPASDVRKLSKFPCQCVPEASFQILNRLIGKEV